MYSTLLLKWDWERSKRLMGTDRETWHMTLKWNVWLCTKLPQLSAGHCHLQHQLLKISRKAAETLPRPHGGSSFLAILQPSYFCEQQRTEGESEVLSCFIRDSHCVYLLFTSGLLISQAVVWKFPIIISTLNEFTFPGRWFPKDINSHDIIGDTETSANHGWDVDHLSLTVCGNKWTK